MAATHRELLGRLGEQVAAVLLETPYAFQENKDEISAKAKRYFGDSVGRPVEILPDLGGDADALAAETAGAAPRSPPPSPSCCGGAAGLRVAVIPHYDNAEGGSHDTRYCYLGERRLRPLEDQLADDRARQPARAPCRRHLSSNRPVGCPAGPQSAGQPRRADDGMEVPDP